MNARLVVKMSDKVIWQYWETRGHKPKFIDGLHEIAKRSCGFTIELVTPQTVHDYLPDLPSRVMEIGELAHKADMIRARLVHHYGGMWLDSDAIVMSDLSEIMAWTDRFDFVGFNNNGQLENAPTQMRINCFAAPKQSAVMAEWVAAQDEKLATKTVFDWTEIGSDLLHPICLRHKDRVKTLPFERICPVPWDRLSRFVSQQTPTAAELEALWLVMMSNKVLSEKLPQIGQMTVDDIMMQQSYLGALMRRASGARCTA